MSKRRRSSGSRRVAEAKFWGEGADEASHEHPDPAQASSPELPSNGDGSEPAPSTAKAKNGSGPADGVMVRPTPDPGALVRSLGAPPLAVDAGLAERHLTAVYEEAVRAASALAAASGLLALDASDN